MKGSPANGAKFLLISSQREQLGQSSGQRKCAHPSRHRTRKWQQPEGAELMSTSNLHRRIPIPSALLTVPPSPTTAKSTGTERGAMKAAS